MNAVPRGLDRRRVGGGRLFRNAAVVTGGLLVGRLLGVFREVVIAYLFGTTGAVDAFVVAVTLPQLILAITSAGAIRSALIPALTEMEGQDGWSGVFAAGNAVVVFTGVIALTVGIFAGPVVSSLAPGLPAGVATTAELLLRILLFAIVLQVVGAVLSATLNYLGYFGVPSLAPAFINGGVVVGTLIAARHLGIKSAVLGWALGISLFVLLQFRLLPQNIAAKIRSFAWRDDTARKTMLAMLPIMGSQALYQSRFVIERFFGSLLPTGGIAALNYAFRVANLPQLIIGNSLIVAALPILSRHAKTRSVESFSRALRKVIRATVIVSIPAGIYLSVFSHGLIRVVFQRGRFGPGATLLTASLVPYYAFSMVLGSILLIQMQACYARSEAKKAVYAMVLAAVVQLCVSAVSVSRMGAAGVAAGTAVGIGTAVIYLGEYIRHVAPRMMGNGMWKLIGGNVLFLAVVTGMRLWLGMHVGAMLLAGVVSCVVYVAYLVLADVEEAVALLGRWRGNETGSEMRDEI